MSETEKEKEKEGEEKKEEESPYLNFNKFRTALLRKPLSPTS